MGWYSLHFDPISPYIDLRDTPKEWKMVNGTHPTILWFENWSYDPITRHFLGDIVFDRENPSNTFYDVSKYTYDLKFSEDFLEIEEGERREFDENG